LGGWRNRVALQLGRIDGTVNVENLGCVVTHSRVKVEVGQPEISVELLTSHRLAELAKAFLGKKIRADWRFGGCQELDPTPMSRRDWIFMQTMSVRQDLWRAPQDAETRKWS
jgi:hypothetical protein